MISARADTAEKGDHLQDDALEDENAPDIGITGGAESSGTMAIGCHMRWQISGRLRIDWLQELRSNRSSQPSRIGEEQV